MGKFAPPAEKRAKLVNDAQREPSAKKNKAVVDKATNIATMDNGTMVEVFKFLNYSRLANCSLVSKRFRNLIQTHRHSFELLLVELSMSIVPCDFPIPDNMFNNELSSKAYNRWVIRNGYSKQIPLDGQVVGKESAGYVADIFELEAVASYEDPLERRSRHDKTVFIASAEFHHENWPLFQHFVRLLTDPFIHIQYVLLTTQNDVLNLLAGTIDSDRGRIHCGMLDIIIKDSVQEFIGWMKNHFSSHQIEFICYEDSNYDKELLDFFVTGAHCTSDITVDLYNLSKIVLDFVQTFTDLKNGDEYQFVETITGHNFSNKRIVRKLKRKYPKYFVKEERFYCYTVHTFKFINGDIKKKMKICAKIYDEGYVGDEDAEDYLRPWLKITIL